MGCSFCRQKRLILFCFSAKEAVKDGLLACERPYSGTEKAVFSADGYRIRRQQRPFLQFPTVVFVAHFSCFICNVLIL